MNFREISVAEFLQRAAAGTATPGGGAAAALGGALGAAMVAMAARLTLGRPKYKDVQARAGELASAADAALRALVDLAEADSQAYDAVTAAMRLPRDDERERAARTAALQAALMEATRVPAAIAQRCAEVLTLAQAAAEIVNTNALGDLATGACLAEGALRASALTVELNLASITNAAFTPAMAAELASRTAGAADRLDAILATVRRRG